MKTKLILGSLLALTFITDAQNTFPIGFGSGNVGIGTAVPAYPLDIQTTAVNGQGLRIKHNGPQQSGGEATIRLDAVTPGGREYGIHSIGNGWGLQQGSLLIRDETALIPRLMILGGSGNVGIGTTSPTEKLSVVTGVSDDGLRITQQTNGASLIRLENQSAGGRTWSLFSYGASSSQGSGNFGIREASGPERLFINGATGNVGIGTTAPTSARLEVRQNINVSPYVNRGIYSDARNTSWSAGTPGASNGSTYGIHGVAGAPMFSTQLADNYGVYGEASGGDAYGGFFSGTTSSGGTDAIGVYGTAFNSGGGAAWAGLFKGDVKINGAAYCTASAWSSDQKLKKDIKPLVNGLEKINLLKPSVYNFKEDEEFKSMNLPKGQQLGLIAQELEKVFPELVSELPESTQKNANGDVTSTPAHKVVNYIGLIPVLISGIQEQQKTIESQQKQLDEQKQLINALTQRSGGTTGIGNNNTIETGFQMSQNEPNPFTHETVVKFTLPQTVSNAFMAVYDLTGKQITTFAITEKGSSSLTMTSDKLAAGIYIYSIVADGKVMDSKRMIVAEK